MDVFWRRSWCHAVTHDNISISVYLNHEAFLSQRLRFRLSCSIKLTVFPVDTRVCSTFVPNYRSTKDLLILFWRRQIEIWLRSPRTWFQLSSFRQKLLYIMDECQRLFMFRMEVLLDACVYICNNAARDHSGYPIRRCGHHAPVCPIIRNYGQCCIWLFPTWCQVYKLHRLLHSYCDRSYLRPARWVRHRELTWRKTGARKYLQQVTFT